MNEEISKTFSAWSDLGSLVLAASCIMVGRLDPRSPIWGYSRPRQFLLFALLFSSLVWSLFRFIHEGVHREAGPREFLAVNVIYIARWAYLWWRMRSRDTREWRLYRVAKALRQVKMVRIGKSKLEGRENDVELVLRSGVQALPKESPPDRVPYWRGLIDSRAFVETQRGNFWYVELLQKHLHGTDLDQFGTTDFLNPDKAKIEEVAYKCFYDVVLTAVAHREPSEDEEQDSRKDPDQGHLPKAFSEEGKPKIEVSFAKFAAKHHGLPVEAMAEKAHAKDPRMIGRVARKIAADACVYVMGEPGTADFRTAEQVELLNKCLEGAVAHVLRTGVLEQSSRQQGNNGQVDSARTPDSSSQPDDAEQQDSASQGGNAGVSGRAEQSNNARNPIDTGRPNEGAPSNHMAQVNERAKTGPNEEKRAVAEGETGNEGDQEPDLVFATTPDIESGHATENVSGEVQGMQVEGAGDEAPDGTITANDEQNPLLAVVTEK